jgi:hypothetical protein
MSFGGPTKYCPRCNTLLPVQATVCSTCGLQFSAPSGQGLGYGAAPYGGQSGPSGWPQSQPAGYPPSQPGYSSPTQQGYGGYAPQGQFGPAGYAPAAVTPAPKKRKTGLIVAILVAVVVIGGGVAGFLYLRGNPSSPFFDRHNLPGNVPLPSNSSFVSMKTVTDNEEGFSFVFNEWIWTVSNSAPANVQQFYTTQLPSNGWGNVRTERGDSDTLDVFACQGSTQVLLIGISQHLQDTNEQGTPTTTVNAPSGGSALGIAISSSPQAVQILCLGVLPTP